MLVGAAWAAPVTLGAAGGLQATLVGDGPADSRLAAAGSNPPGHFLHPLQTASGKILTELYPADHIHHRGLFWGWRQVLLNGKPIANNWLMQGMRIHQTSAVTSADGGVTSTAMWRVDGKDILEERLTARIESNRLDMQVELRPKVPGLSLGGSSDAKEYGGVSLRLVQSDRLNFESGGKQVLATVGPVDAGRSMRMTWDAGVDAPATSVTLSCTVDGKPITRWILRRETSMQNCVWPGRSPMLLSMREPVKLGATLLVEP
ncbi:DUF6807 family protein [Sandaracinobacteroides hominis]|uniref:DUF6807 family protein n=1 Tax=Sandaracinobacteroides hominis TaxID=2780086 RepID=UPI0018F7C9BD|nr:DUF6807 family protein [Sandaracinobacteroides hominis]